MGAINPNIPTDNIVDKSKTLVCKRNHKLLKGYGIVKGQIVIIENDSINLVKYFDKEMKQDRYIKLSQKLLRRFKEINKTT